MAMIHQPISSDCVQSLGEDGSRMFHGGDIAANLSKFYITLTYKHVFEVLEKITPLTEYLLAPYRSTRAIFGNFVVNWSSMQC